MDESPFFMAGQGIDSYRPHNETKHVFDFMGYETCPRQPYSVKHER